MDNLWECYSDPGLLFNFVIISLLAELASPLSQAGLARNPAAKNAGKFMTLDDFLNFAKTTTVSGILINIEVQTEFLFSSFVL